MDDIRLANIRRLTMGFQTLVGVALVVIGLLVVRPLWTNEFRVSFLTVGGLQTLTEKDLNFSQRAVVVVLAGLPDLCWMYGLVQLLSVSWRFRRAEFFSEAVIARIQRFGWALGVMAVAEVVSIPAIVAYLMWLKKIDSPESWWCYLINGQSLNSLLAAVLVLIVAGILRIAMQIHEESRLTI